MGNTWWLGTHAPRSPALAGLTRGSFVVESSWSAGRPFGSLVAHRDVIAVTKFYDAVCLDVLMSYVWMKWVTFLVMDGLN